MKSLPVLLVILNVTMFSYHFIPGVYYLQVYSETEDTTKVFAEVKPLLTSLLDG